MKAIPFMKQTLLIFLFIFIVFTSNAQEQKNSLSGKILDTDNNILPGSNVIIVGTKFGVNSNEAGEYLFDQLPTGKLKIQASFVGFKTIIIDFDVQPGQNNLDLTLDYSDIKLDGVTVLSQKREQQILDVPITMSVINADLWRITTLRNLINYLNLFRACRSGCRELIVQVLLSGDLQAMK